MCEDHNEMGGQRGRHSTDNNQFHSQQSDNTVQGPRLEENNPVGDIMMLPKPRNTTRIYMINPDGLTVGAHGTWSLNLDHIKAMEVDIAMMPEIKLDTTQPSVVNSLHKSARRCLGLDSYQDHSCFQCYQVPQLQQARRSSIHDGGSSCRKSL